MDDNNKPLFHTLFVHSSENCDDNDDEAASVPDPLDVNAFPDSMAFPITVTAFVPNLVQVNLIQSPIQKHETEILWRDLSRTAFFSRPSIFSSDPTWDLTIYENRLRTFKDQWTLNFITPTQMAKSGLYYLGVQDRVKCVFCSKVFEGWLRGEDPFVEHKKKSPECQFFKERQVYDVCGPYDSPPLSESIPDGGIDRVQNFLCSMGVVKNARVLSHNKIFSSFDTRLSSFEKCKKKLNQDIITLCEAGFHYIGDGENDKMVCYCCNQGLMDWEQHDNPWEEHARWSASCSFMLLSRGRHFVETMSGKVDNSSKMHQKELCKLITIHKDVSILKANTTTDLIQRKPEIPETVISKEQFSDESGKEQIYVQEPKAVPDSVLCKICFREKIEVLFIPCGHMFACIQCAVTLDECAVCRQPYMMFMRMYICVNKSVQNYLSKEVAGSLLKSDEPNLGSILCNVCHQEEMRVAFIPCRHVSSCFQCTLKKKQCPICFEAYYGFIQVYL